tara:strand:+ start:351 stop:716 length:366 start_codon:yes stop_codon:yes gene_type:complete
MKALNFNQAQSVVALFMKKLILIAAFLSIGVSITHGQEYKVVCKQISGCPVINGTCPTCVMVENKEETSDDRLERMLKKMEYDFKREYEPDLSKRYAKPSGWGIIRWNINEALRVRKDYNF